MNVGTIIGYLLISPAAGDQPWGRLGEPRILDVSIEVARGYRGRGLASAMFGRLVPPALVRRFRQAQRGEAAA
jgi:hypothetical protein